MLALHTAADAPHVRMAETADPHPLPQEALVRVRAISLNRGEILDLPGSTEGEAIGWDFAGTVERAAADHRGPPVGARVFGLVRRGAWAELVAAPTHQLAVTPTTVSDAEAATLPTAGLTALGSLELGGLVLAKRVLVTGATGGVGRYAVQLAALAGAEVTALVRDPAASGRPLRCLGASGVVDTIDGEFDLIVDAVGGATFATAIEHVASRGAVVNLATGSHDEIVSFHASHFDRAAGATIHTFNLAANLHPGTATDLDRLARLMERGKLVAPLEFEAPWTDAAHAIDALLTRAVSGKVVLHVGEVPSSQTDAP